MRSHFINVRQKPSCMLLFFFYSITRTLPLFQRSIYLSLFSPVISLSLSVSHTGVNLLLSPVCLCGAAIMPLSTYLNYVSVSVSVWQWGLFVSLCVCVCALGCICVLHLLNLGPLISSSGWTQSLSGPLSKRRPFSLSLFLSLSACKRSLTGSDSFKTLFENHLNSECFKVPS